MNAQNMNYKMQEKNEAAPQPVHLEVATIMINDLMDRFNPTEQNLAIKHMISILRDRREGLIADAHKHAEFLKETLIDLTKI